MHTAYLDGLIDALRRSEITCRDGRPLEWEAAFEEVVGCFSRARKRGSQLFFVGNGGSAAIAHHMTTDFMKNGGMRTVSLLNSSLLTCMGNDYGYEQVFARPLSRLAREGDLLVAVSSSGNSPNIVNAIRAGREAGTEVITCSGFHPGNRIRGMGDWNIYVPSERYGFVESIHNLLLQQVVDTLLVRENHEKELQP